MVRASRFKWLFQAAKIGEATDFDNAVDKFATKNSNLFSNSAGRGIVISNSNNIYSIDEELIQISNSIYSNRNKVIIRLETKSNM